MADIFDEIQPTKGDIFDEVGAASPQAAYDPVGDTKPLPGYGDVAWGDVPAFLGSNISMAGKTFKSRVPLAALGAAGLEGYHQAYQAITDDPNTPSSMLESAKRMANVAGAYGIGQAGGEVLMPLARKLWPHVQDKFKLSGLESAEAQMRTYMDPYLEKGMGERFTDWARSKMPSALQWEQYQKPGFTLAQKTDPLSGVSQMEQMVGASFSGKGPLARFKWAQEKGLQDWADDLSSTIWGGVEKLPPSEQGKVFAQGFEVAEKKFMEDAKALYAQVDGLTKTKPITITWPQTSPSFNLGIRNYVDVSSVVKNAKNLAAENAKFKGLGATDRGESIIKQIAGQNPQMTFSEAAELRSRLIKAAGQMGGDVGRGRVNSFIGQVDEAMEKAASGLPNNAKEAWRAANAFYREGKQVYGNEFIKSLVKKGEEQPELVGKALFQNGEITQVRAAREVLKYNPQAWQNLKAGYLESLIENARSVSTDPSLVGKTLSRQLKNMGVESLKEIFTVPELLMIQNFEKAALATQSKAPSSGGSMLIQLMQGGAVGSAVSGAVFKEPGLVFSGLGLLGAPRVIANMMVNPKWHSLFMQGLSADKARAIPAITKLAAGAVEVDRKLKEMESDRKLQQQIKDQAQYR